MVLAASNGDKRQRLQAQDELQSASYSTIRNSQLLAQTDNVDKFYNMHSWALINPRRITGYREFDQRTTKKAKSAAFLPVLHMISHSS